MRDNFVLTWPSVRTSVRPPHTCKLMSNVIFSTTILTCITEKLLEREIRQQKRRILLEEKHENFIAVMKKWEMLAATNVKVSGREKKACNQEVSRQQRNVRKSVLHLKRCFLLIRPIDFFCRFRCRRRLVHTILFFAWVNYNLILTRASLLALAKSIY